MPTQSAAFDATTRRVHVVVRYAFRALLFSVCFLHCLYIHIRGCLDEKTHHTRKVSRFDERALCRLDTRGKGANVETDTEIRG